MKSEVTLIYSGEGVRTVLRFAQNCPRTLIDR